jgi:hypothetical protein
MKNVVIIVVCVFAFGMQTCQSQTADENMELLIIREDKVRLSMAETYELALLDLSSFLDEQNEKNIHYLTHVLDNYLYTRISPIKELADYEDGIQEYIEGKKQSGEFNFIWGVMMETLVSYRSYVVGFDKEYSYLPEGSTWLEGQPYRKWNYYYFSPGTKKEVDKILAAWKALYEKNDIKTGYMIYRGMLGIDQPLVIFTSWAKNPLEHHQEVDANSKLLGEEGSALLLGMLELANRVETTEGYFVPEFSYQPDK